MHVLEAAKDLGDGGTRVRDGLLGWWWCRYQHLCTLVERALAIDTAVESTTLVESPV